MMTLRGLYGTLLKQVRGVISSTFQDVHAERDHLVTVVFPELRARGEQLGFEFFDVDSGRKEEFRRRNDGDRTSVSKPPIPGYIVGNGLIVWRRSWTVSSASVSVGCRTLGS